MKLKGKINEFSDVPSPYWIASTPETNYPVLDKDIEVDVAIAGGGIAGITSAYLLSKEGMKVAVLEADRILQGTTGHTTAKITSQHSLIYARLLKEMGEELSRQYAEANEAAIHMISKIVDEHDIDCNFVWRPAYLYTQSDDYVKQIEEEAQAGERLGIMASILNKISLPFPVKTILRFDHQAQFHPLKYLQALALEITRRGSYIFEQTQAVDIEENQGCSVITSNGKKVKADKVIIATHYPFYDGGGFYFSRVYAEKSYIIGVTIDGTFPKGMFISAENPTRSLRSQSMDDGELILVAGEHHKTGQSKNTNLHYHNLIDFAHETFRVQDIRYRWSTQDYMTLDGVPYVGHLTTQSPNIYVATGFGKWGMTNSTAASMILSDLIRKGDSPWAEVYKPSRSTSATSIKNFIVQNANVAKTYIAGKLEPALNDVEIPVGEARVIDVDGQKMGAYKDEAEKLHIVDITCPHVGCELEWNHAELSWDCPCHGSRFTFEGDIIEGPAQYCLSHIEEGPNPIEPNVFP
ncbi:MAG TPA: FAD-dependent oxidoreductase [Syntrophomonadaceae bacterium]|nr:FAD-dependent oxidoreductase [Syntrophomonadaceae bacterium]